MGTQEQPEVARGPFCTKGLRNVMGADLRVGPHPRNHTGLPGPQDLGFTFLGHPVFCLVAPPT